MLHCGRISMEEGDRGEMGAVHALLVYNTE